jgi:hypothetical protein
MKTKKGIILFTTLLFIIALSVLIVKNLAITDEFITISSKNANIKQLEITIKDINSEILKLFKDKDVKILSDFPQTIPFDYGNVRVELQLEEYSKKTYKLDNKLSKNIDSYFTGFINQNVLLEVIKDKNITNQKQVDFVIDEYINTTNDYKILEIEEQLTYLDLNNSSYVSCKYHLDIDGLQADVAMLFVPNTKGIVKPDKLEIIIKR